MTKTSPTKLPLREFLGKYPSLMEQAYVAEKRTRFPNLAALADLAGERESETPRMITSGADWNEVAQWWPIGVLRQAAQDGG
jgi:hypothetical protein